MQQIVDFLQPLFGNVVNLDWKMVVMWIIGGVLIYLAIKKDMEPTLLLPMGFGAILVNLPLSGVITRVFDSGVEEGALSVLFDAGIANELFPLILFIGIGAMIDFGPLLSNPKLMLFGAAAQFGIFFTLSIASLLGFDLKDAASIAHRCGRRPDLHFRCTVFQFQLRGCHHGCRLFLHGFGTACTTPDYQAFNHQKRAPHPHAL